MKRIGSPKNCNIQAFFAKCCKSSVRAFRKKINFCTGHLVFLFLTYYCKCNKYIVTVNNSKHGLSWIISGHAVSRHCKWKKVFTHKCGFLLAPQKRGDEGLMLFRSILNKHQSAVSLHSPLRSCRMRVSLILLFSLV